VDGSAAGPEVGPGSVAVNDHAALIEDASEQERGSCLDSIKARDVDIASCDGAEASRQRDRSKGRVIGQLDEKVEV